MAPKKKVRSLKKHNPRGLYRKTWDKMAYKLVLLGAGNKELADFFEIGLSTIDKIIKTEPTFKEALTEARTIANANVAQAFYHRAIGYSHPDQVILSNQVKEYNEDGKVIKSYNKPLIIPTTKYYPPDGYSCQKWLALKDRQRWSDTTNININSTVNHNVQINYLAEAISDPKQYTTEELNEVLELALKESVKESGLSNN
jgi:hypothetical protein